MTLAGIIAFGGYAVMFAQDDFASLRILQGIAHHQVLQRDNANSATIHLDGSTHIRTRGTIHVTVIHQGNPLEGFLGRETGAAEGGRCSAEIKGLPVGGPYRIDLQLRDGEGRPQAETSIFDVLVGDLWLLAGQSNMMGRGELAGAEQSSGSVRVFDMADRWLIAEEPLHRSLEARDPVYWSIMDNEERARAAAEARRTQKDGAGLGLPFAKEIVRHTGVPVGLIPCALGGSSISQWDPALQAQGGGSLYGAMLRRFRAAGGRIKGMLWYQGEADARNPEAVSQYDSRLRQLISSVRRDFGQPALPFHLVQLGRMLDWVYFGNNGRPPPPKLEQQWMDFREIQRRVDEQVEQTAMAVAVDLDLGDAIHLSTDSLKRLGIRLARGALVDLYGVKHWQTGPRLDSVRLDPAGRRIYVRYTGVNGSLRAPGRISGFSLHREDGTEVAAIYRADPDPARPDSLVLSLGSEVPADTALAYGWGTNPHCNLVDAADMAAPCFGPVRLNGKSAQ